MENRNLVKQYNPLPALRRFAMAITILNILGHFYLGFEQSWAHPIVALITSYLLEIFFEAVYAYKLKRTPRFAGGWVKFLDFLLPAHITGLAVSMLLFSNEGLLPVIFACAVAICSKILFRTTIDSKNRHFLNPSNTGIAITLVVFPWVGIAPPYQFTENIFGLGDWILPLILIMAGSFLNYKFTNKTTLIISWLIGFVLQAFIRSLFFDMSLIAALLPMTGVAFLLFTFYMISDPATTPSTRKGQILFGFSVAFMYGILMINHIVFGLFFALIIVCAMRGVLYKIISLSFPYPKFINTPHLSSLMRRLNL